MWQYNIFLNQFTKKTGIRYLFKYWASFSFELYFPIKLIEI